MPTEEQTYRTYVQETLRDIKRDMKDGFSGVHERQDEANHKVHKIIIALVLAFGLIIGIGFDKFAPVLSLLIAI